MRYKIKYTTHQNGGANLADFLPYSDHDKMSEESKLKNPRYCPDLFPFLCNNNSVARGKCRKLENECNKDKIIGEREVNYLVYTEKS